MKQNKTIDKNQKKVSFEGRLCPYPAKKFGKEVETDNISEKKDGVETKKFMGAGVAGAIVRKITEASSTSRCLYKFSSQYAHY